MKQHRTFAGLDRLLDLRNDEDIERSREASDYVAEHAKYAHGEYSVVLPNGHTLHDEDTWHLARKVERAMAR